VENLRFTFAGDARVYEWEPDGGFEETDWDFEIFSPDGEWVVLLQSTDGPYHVVATSRLKQYLLGEAGPDAVLEQLTESETALLYSGARWLSATELEYRVGGETDFVFRYQVGGKP